MKAIKKFFKWSFIVVGAMILLGVIIGVAGGGDTETTSNGTENVEKSEKEKKKEENIKAKYDQIKQGDTLTGEGGMSKDEVIALLGEPDDKIESQYTGVDGETIKQEDWSWYSFTQGSVSISFTNGHVSHKMWMD